MANEQEDPLYNERESRRKAKENVGEIQFEESWEAIFDRHYALVALVSLCPKKGQTWTEERMMLWIEIVEKTARLIYGLPSEWDHMRIIVHEDDAEPEPEKPAVPKRPESSTPTPQAPTPPTPRKPVEAPKLTPKQQRQWQNGELDTAVLDVLARSNVTLRRREIAEKLGANDSTMTDVLARLRTDGKIRKIGTSSDITYDIVRVPKQATSPSCEVPGCILAAAPGTTRCERHTRAKAAA